MRLVAESVEDLELSIKCFAILLEESVLALRRKLWEVAKREQKELLL